MKMKKTFILLVVFLSVCAIFVSGIDHVYADNGKGSRTGDSGKNENVTSNETLNSSSSSNAASNTTSSTKDSSEFTFQSSDENVATVDENGTVHAVGNVEEIKNKINYALDNTDKISCGPIKGMSKSIPRATSLVVLFIEILTPALLIVFGMLDFYKAIASGVDENIKKNRNAFFNIDVDTHIQSAFLLVEWKIANWNVNLLPVGTGLNGNFYN